MRVTSRIKYRDDVFDTCRLQILQKCNPDSSDDVSDEENKVFKIVSGSLRISRMHNADVIGCETSSDVSSCMCNGLAYQRLRSSILEQGYRDRDAGTRLTRDAEA